MKLWIFSLFIIFSIAPAQAIYLNNQYFNQGNNIYLHFVSVTADNYSCCIANTMSMNISNHSVTFTAGANKTITSPSYNLDNFTFSLSGLSYINFSVAMQYSNTEYTLKSSGISIESKNTTLEKIIWFNYTSIGDTVITVIQSPLTSSGDFIPPVPVSCIAVQGGWSINTSCSAGTGNITDSMNKTDGFSWVNSTDFWVNNLGMSPHSWSNISFFAFNKTGNISLNLTPATLNTKLNNHIPIQNSIGNKLVLANDTLTIQIISTDLDGDILIYDTSATKGTSFNPNTGLYIWNTTQSDVGTYMWNFNTTDNYSAVASETIIVTVSTSIPATLSSIFEASQRNLYSIFSNTIIVFSLAIMVLGFSIILHGLRKQKAPIILTGIMTAILGFAILLIGNYIVTAINSVLVYP